MPCAALSTQGAASEGAHAPGGPRAVQVSSQTHLFKPWWALEKLTALEKQAHTPSAWKQRLEKEWNHAAEAEWS